MDCFVTSCELPGEINPSLLSNLGHILAGFPPVKMASQRFLCSDVITCNNVRASCLIDEELETSEALIPNFHVVQKASGSERALLDPSQRADQHCRC